MIEVDDEIRSFRAMSMGVKLERVELDCLEHFPARSRLDLWRTSAGPIEHGFVRFTTLDSHVLQLLDCSLCQIDVLKHEVLHDAILHTSIRGTGIICMQDPRTGKLLMTLMVRTESDT